MNRYDLVEEFPALTPRPTAIKTAVDEMLWIWQRKSNNIKDLKGHIWDEMGRRERFHRQSLRLPDGDKIQILPRGNGPGGQCHLAVKEYTVLQAHIDQYI